MTQTTKRPKAPRKKPRRSQEDIMAAAFLRKTFKPAKPMMMMAWLFDVFSVLVLVAQVFVLVWIFEVWFDWATVPEADPKAFMIQSLGVLEVKTAVFLLFGCMVVRAFIAYGRDYLLTKVGLMVAKSVRQDLLAKLGQLGLARRYFGSDGTIATKIVDEPDHLIGYARFEVQKMTAVTTPVLLAGCVSFYSWTAAAILLLTAPLVPIFMAVIGIATARKSREQMDALAQLGGRFLDWIRGVRTLSRLGAVEVAVADIDKSSESYRSKTMSVLRVAFLNSAVLEFLSALSIALVAVYLGLGLLGQLPWADGQILTDYGTALFILLLVPEFYAPLRRLGAEYHVKGQAVACAKAIAPILAFKNKNPSKDSHRLQGLPSFELNNLTAFGDDGRVRLSPTTLMFEAGKITALTGESGAGKSTILQILLGFGDYEGDVIVHDGGKMVRYADIDVASVRVQLGYLAQSAVLLPLTIGENLRLAKPSATDDELWTALSKVGLEGVIRALAKGLDTPLGERGQGMSGGQGQRLAIAQLLLQDAKVWLLDEPTEHLDAKTASQINALLHALGKDKTVIWVTHDGNLDNFDAVHRLGAV